MDAAKAAVILSELERGSSLEQAAAEAGVSRTTVWRHRKAEPDFDAAYQVAVEAGDSVNVAKAEAKLMELVERGYFPAICFYLVNRGGGRWHHVQRREIELQGDSRRTLVDVIRAAAKSAEPVLSGAQADSGAEGG